VFADALLALERAHLARLLVWGAGSVLAGTSLLALVAVRRAAGPAPLLWHFAVQTAAWGAVDLALALWAGAGSPCATTPGLARSSASCGSTWASTWATWPWV
jgi:hypothetical protein